MDQNVLNWLLEEENPEVRLRTLKDYQKLSEDNEIVVSCKEVLLHSASSNQYHTQDSDKTKRSKWRRLDSYTTQSPFTLPHTTDLAIYQHSHTQAPKTCKIIRTFFTSPVTHRQAKKESPKKDFRIIRYTGICHNSCPLFVR